MFVLFALAALAFGQPSTGRVAGTVVDARGGEPLARARARLVNTTLEAITDDHGKFAIEAVPPGDYILQVETVGYRLVRQPFTLAERGSANFDVLLSPETFRRTDRVEVAADVFDVSAPAPIPGALTMTGAEIKNLGTVLMDDPMRAVQAMPGVSAADDFESRFNLRGAGFERMGLYLDDVLVHSPFHAAGANEGNGSLSMLNGEMISDIALFPMNEPSRYGDRSAGVVQMYTRDGSRNKTSARISAGVADSSGLVEGPFAKGRGSWIVSARKSYVQYLLNRVTTDTALALGFEDVQGKATYSLTPRQTVSLYVLDGITDVDRSAARDRSGVNALIGGQTHATLAKASWQYTPSATLVVNGAGAWIRERFDASNRYDQPLENGAYGEWTGNGRVIWNQHPSSALEAGASIRRMRDQGAVFNYLNQPWSVRQNDAHRGTALLKSGYAEQNWRGLNGRVRLAAGVRFDSHDFFESAVASPQASLAAPLPAGFELQAAWGQYVQFPELTYLASRLGGRRLAPERANHLSAAVERRVAAHARVRMEAWNRDDRDLLAEPLFDVRLVGNAVRIPGDARYFNSVRGYSRGLQWVWQQRSANRIDGWVSYTLSWARQRDGMTGQPYWAVEDQRHIANAYLAYRLRPSLNLSARYSYGSGQPVPGFLRLDNGLYYIAATRNDVRLPSYQRADVRANKSFTYDRWKLTLYGEVIPVQSRQPALRQLRRRRHDLPRRLRHHRPRSSDPPRSRRDARILAVLFSYLCASVCICGPKICPISARSSADK